MYLGVMSSQNYETHNLIKKNWDSLLGIFATLSRARKEPKHRRISKGHELTMTNLGLVLSPNHGTRNVQNVCSNMFLSWKHERRFSPSCENAMSNAKLKTLVAKVNGLKRLTWIKMGQLWK